MHSSHALLLVRDRPIPGLSVPDIPQHTLDLSSNKLHKRHPKKTSTRSEEHQQLAEDDRGEGSSKAGSSEVAAKGKNKEPERDTATYQPELSRKQKMKVCSWCDSF